jgi:hypothetical protein
MPTIPSKNAPAILPENTPANHPAALPIPNISPAQNGKLAWLLPTWLVHPTRGNKFSLLAQNNGVKAVIQDAIMRTLQHIAFKDSFPSGEQKVRIEQNLLYCAADNGGHDEIAHRLTQDRNYGRWLSSIVRVPIISVTMFSSPGSSRLMHGSVSSKEMCVIQLAPPSPASKLTVKTRHMNSYWRG